MKTYKHTIAVLIAAIVLVSLSTTPVLSQEKHGPLAQIIIYKGETAGTGPGISVLKMTVGEEITVTAKGIDSEGKEVPIWPTCGKLTKNIPFVWSKVEARPLWSRP